MDLVLCTLVLFPVLISFRRHPQPAPTADGPGQPTAHDADARGRSGRTELPALSQDNEKHQVATALCTYVKIYYTSNSKEKVVLSCVCVCIVNILVQTS